MIWNSFWNNTICNRSDPLMVGQGDGSAGNRRTNRNHPIYRLIKISQNTEKLSRRPEENTCNSNSNANQSADTYVKKLHWVITIIIIIIIIISVRDKKGWKIEWILLCSKFWACTFFPFVYNYLILNIWKIRLYMKKKTYMYIVAKT